MFLKNIKNYNEFELHELDDPIDGISVFMSNPLCSFL